MSREVVLNRLVVCLLSVFSHLIADDIRPFCILTDREGAGMFSMFSDVLALVDCYDRGIFQGVEIDFGEKGLYWVKNYGPNWWNYYSEPISLGEKNNVFKGEYSELPNMARRYDYKDRKEAYNLIEKYIHFRPYLLKEVENFVHAHFDGCYVIGIHYRGTDAGGQNQVFTWKTTEHSEFGSGLSCGEARAHGVAAPSLELEYELDGEAISLQVGVAETEGLLAVTLTDIREIRNREEGMADRKKTVADLAALVAPLQAREEVLRSYYEELRNVEVEEEKRALAQQQAYEAEKKVRISRKKMGID